MLAVTSPSPILVRPNRQDPTKGRLQLGNLNFSCALGRSGATFSKKEGDGATPFARMRLLAGYYRADRLLRPVCPLPLIPIAPQDGWCDDVADGRYNCPIRLPAACGHERMWRDDRLYDIVFVLDWNISSRSRGRGSAIFFHLAHDDLRPTEGCVALRPGDMRRVLPHLSFGLELVVQSA